jgi:hypothetical protein
MPTGLIARQPARKPFMLQRIRQAAGIACSRPGKVGMRVSPPLNWRGRGSGEHKRYERGCGVKMHQLSNLMHWFRLCIELRELQHRLGITSVYVTHDLEEALAMSDRIVVMRDGLIEQTRSRRGRVDRIRNTSRTHRLRNGLWTPRGGAELVVSMRTVHLGIWTDRPRVSRSGCR